MTRIVMKDGHSIIVEKNFTEFRKEFHDAVEESSGRVTLYTEHAIIRLDSIAYIQEVVNHDM